MSHPVAIPSMPGAITALGSPGTEMRIGVVTSVNAGLVGVSVSGANVLNNAPYAFGQYQPNLGDNVVVMRMDNQWVVLCALSNNPSNNPVANPSFEADLASPPGSWTLYHDPASTEAADVDAIALGAGLEIDGPQAVRFQLDASAPGTSIDYISSEPIAVVPGELWTASAWAVGQSVSGAPCVRAAGSVRLTFHANNTQTYPAFFQENVLISTRLPSTLPWILLRGTGDFNGVYVPDGALFMRVVLGVDAAHDSCTTNSTLSVYWDRVVATRLS